MSISKMIYGFAGFLGLFALAVVVLLILLARRLTRIHRELARLNGALEEEARPAAVGTDPAPEAALGEESG